MNFDLFQNAFQVYAEFSKTNPVISGVASLWAAGLVTYLLKETPSATWRTLVKHFTVRVVINCRDEAFWQFIKWYEERGHSKNSRTLRLSGDKDSSLLSAGYGNHYFLFDHWPFCMNRKRVENASLYDVRESIEITTIGRSQIMIRHLLREISPTYNSAETTKVKKWMDDHWSFSNDQVVRPLESIILPDSVQTQLIEHLDKFRSNKSWYQFHGIPYRTGICLHGPPGTGKTSLVRAICGMDRRDLYVLSLNGLTDRRLAEAVDGVDENGVLLIEDIDTYDESTKRTAVPHTSGNQGNKSLSLSGLLNAIDGISGSNGRIIILTTNHVTRLDPALLRPGRIDLKLELGYFNNETVQKAFRRFFPDFRISTIELKKNITPAEFQNLVLLNKESPEKVLNQIQHRANQSSPIIGFRNNQRAFSTTRMLSSPSTGMSVTVN